MSGPPPSSSRRRGLSLTRDDVRVRNVTITGDTIRLGQLLKLADAAPTGGDVKPLLAAGAVTVNGEVETRRGRQLSRGDVVSVAQDDILLS